MFRGCIKEVILGRDPWFGVVPDSERCLGFDGIVDDLMPILQDWFERIEFRGNSEVAQERCERLAKAHLDLLMDSSKYIHPSAIVATPATGSNPVGKHTTVVYNWSDVSHRCPFCGLRCVETQSESCRGQCSGCRAWEHVKSHQNLLIQTQEPYTVFKRRNRKRDKAKKATTTTTKKRARSKNPKTKAKTPKTKHRRPNPAQGIYATLFKTVRAADKPTNTSASMFRGWDLEPALATKPARNGVYARLQRYRQSQQRNVTVTTKTTTTRVSTSFFF